MSQQRLPPFPSTGSARIGYSGTSQLNLSAAVPTSAAEGMSLPIYPPAPAGFVPEVLPGSSPPPYPLTEQMPQPGTSLGSYVGTASVGFRSPEPGFATEVPPTSQMPSSTSGSFPPIAQPGAGGHAGAPYGYSAPTYIYGAERPGPGASYGGNSQPSQAPVIVHPSPGAGGPVGAPYMYGAPTSAHPCATSGYTGAASGYIGVTSGSTGRVSAYGGATSGSTGPISAYEGTTQDYRTQGSRLDTSRAGYPQPGQGQATVPPSVSVACPLERQLIIGRRKRGRLALD